MARGNSPMENMVKQILMTGGTGFLGSHLVNKLAEENQIIVLKRSFSKTWRIDNKKNIKYYDIDKIDRPDPQLLENK